MTVVFMHRDNCKNSKQVLDIFAVRKDNEIELLNLDDFPQDKQDYVLGKYKIRDIPCIITDSKILYSSEMFTYVKSTGSEEQSSLTSEGFFMSSDTGSSMQFASSVSCNCPVDRVCNCSGMGEVSQVMFGSVDGISGSSPQEAVPKKKGRKGKGGGSEVDRRYEQMMESRNQDSTRTPVHNNRDVDFSQPINRI